MNWIKRFFFLILIVALIVALIALVVGRFGSTGEGGSSLLSVIVPTPEPTPPVHLAAVLTAEELASLDCTLLESLDLTGSTCYEAIERFQREHPAVELRYAVVLTDGETTLNVEPDAQTLTLSGDGMLQSLAENAAWLPALTEIQIEADSASAAQADAVREAFPNAAVSYSCHLLGELYPYDQSSLRLEGLRAADLDRLVGDLVRFERLERVELPQENNELSLQDALSLQQRCPSVQLDYQVSLFGEPVSLSAERLEYEEKELGADWQEQLRALLPSMTKLQYLKLDNCRCEGEAISNETLAQLRDDFPDIKVVWRVFFGNYHCLTDTEMIWATGSSVNDNTAPVLQYCTDVKYMDLGHSLITNVDFARNMPNLEVLVLAITWVQDISALASCPNLEYLELFTTRVTDFSPLASCTHLQHLNISHSVNADNLPVHGIDISCLYSLPELKRFYCTMSYISDAQKVSMIAQHPDCEIDFSWEDPAEGPWRFDENGEPNERYALLREQFNYDSLQQSGKTWSLYG